MHIVLNWLYTRLISSKTGLFVLLFLFPVSSFALPVLSDDIPATPQAAQYSPNWGEDENAIFLPIAIRQVYTDLTIDNYEITQGIQDSTNGVPLVAGRETVLRAYVRTNTTFPISNIYLDIFAEQNGQPLPGSPMRVGPANVTNNPSRKNILSTMNAHLPQGWLSAQVELNLQLNPNQAVEESDYENNSLAASLSFREMPALDVMVVPIAWDGINGYYPAPTSFDYIQRSLEKMYPVSQVIIHTHPNFNYDGPLESSFGWNDLLDEIWLLRSREKAPAGRSYYGLIPAEDPQGRTWLYYSNGIRGNGFVGERAAIGLASSANYGIDGGVIAAHETGHNLGRLHSPCGTTLGVGFYPYSGAAIGNYGLDVTNLTGFNLIPSDYKDIMSYCTPVWVSDYTYAIWMESQEDLLTQSPQLPDQAGIMIRAQIDSNGEIQLLPSYAFEGQVEKSRAAGKYRIELIGSQGTLLGRYNLSPLQYGDSHGGLLSALLPLPQEAVSEVRIFSPDQTKTRKFLDSTSSAPLGRIELVAAPGGALIRWGQPDTPALISYTQIDDPSIITLEIDWMGGEYFLDPAALPSGELQFEILLADQTTPALRVNWTNTQP